MQILYKFTKEGITNEFQKAMFADFDTRMLIGQGGYGSGKTFEACMHAIKLSYLNRKVPGGFLCPSYSEYKRDVLPTFEQIFLDNRIDVRIANQTNAFHFPWAPNKPMYVFTAEKKLRGPNIGWAVCNEFSLIPYERIKELIGRVRMKCPNPQKVLVGTPDDIFGWYDEFIDSLKDGKEEDGSPVMRIIQGKTTDNPYLDKTYVKNLEAVLDPQQIRLFIYGHKVNLTTDAFYYSFNEDSNLKDVKFDDRLPVHVALDFNVGNMHAICGQLVYEAGAKKLNIFEEIVLKDHGSDTNQMGQAIMTRFGRDAIITCDASGKSRKTSGLSDVEILKGMGFNVRYRAANPRHRYRQLLVNGLLSHSKIAINPDCRILIRDLVKVSQNRATFDKIDRDANLTHASDCLDYLCDQEFELNVKRREFIKKKVGT